MIQEIDTRDIASPSPDSRAAYAQIARRAAWETHARYGMGPDSSSLEASLQSIEADFNVSSAL